MKFIFERKDINTKRIFTHGRSLGGATSLYAITESEFQVRGAILENTFASIDEISKVYFPPILTKFNPFILKNKWDSVGRINKLKVPTLFIKSNYSFKL